MFTLLTIDVPRPDCEALCVLTLASLYPPEPVPNCDLQMS